LAALNFALAPAERFGALVVFLDEGFNGLAQLIFVFEAGPAEGFALQQAEHDLNLVQPTGGSRREVKLDTTLELSQPVIVSFMGGIVVEDDVDFFVLRLLGEHTVEEALKVFPLLVVGKLRVNLAGADFQGGEQIQCPWRL
jgi:hypothetical protein